MRPSKIQFAVLLLFTLFLFHSCKNSESDISSFITLDITNGLVKKKKHYLSEITKDYQLIKLETNPHCLINKIYKIYFAKDKIIVLDGSPFFGTRGPEKQSLLIFDNKGRFLNKIGKKGKGPGEYHSIINLCIDERNEIIYVLSGDQSIIQYRFSGEFLTKTK